MHLVLRPDAGRKDGPANGQVNPSFNVINRDTRPIAAIFVSPVVRQGRDWGPNRLAAGFAMEPVVSVHIYPPSGECRYDVQVVYAGGQAAERRGTDTCRVSFVNFH